jgi:hypothetical protein
MTYRITLAVHVKGPRARGPCGFRDSSRAPSIDLFLRFGKAGACWTVLCHAEVYATFLSMVTA